MQQLPGIPAYWHGSAVNASRFIILALLVAAIATWMALDAGGYLGLETLQQRYTVLHSLVQEHPVAASLTFFWAYVTIAAVSIPGGALACTLTGGALFGFSWGCVLVSFASSCGATAACAIARFLLREFIEQRFPQAVAQADAGLRSNGAWYLLGLRLATVVPYWIINLAMGLTRLPLRTFYWVSQLGMLPSTLIFVNAGTQLARVRTAADILSPGLAASLVLLGLFPLLARRLATGLLARRSRREAGR